jgi:hypothetical protein
MTSYTVDTFKTTDGHLLLFTGVAFLFLGGGRVLIY